MSENLSIYLLILNLQFLGGEPNYHKYYLTECAAIVDGILASLSARVENHRFKINIFKVSNREFAGPRHQPVRRFDAHSLRPLQCDGEIVILGFDH